MTDVQRNILVAGLVCATSVSLIGGIYYREQVDTAASGPHANELLAPGLSASRQTEVEPVEERHFIEVTKLLQRHYVDPIADEDKLAVGAVRGMIASLDDERSLFMSPPMFRAFVRSLSGQFEGIGASLVLTRNGAARKGAPIRNTLDYLGRIPLLKVAFVAPGGPADRAGLRPGDEIESIDGRWVVSPEVGERYRRIDAGVREGKLPVQARTDLQDELRRKFGNSMMPVRALERLSAGVEGTIKLEWRRQGKVLSSSLDRAPSEVEVNRRGKNGEFRLSFVPGAPEALKEALADGKPLTLDLRGSNQGDLKIMLACLQLVVPDGEYGAIARERGEAEPVKIVNGAKKASPLGLRTDGFTRGLAEAFVLALRTKAAVAGEAAPMAGDPAIVERIGLPDGSGFTLRVGDYRPPGVGK